MKRRNFLEVIANNTCGCSQVNCTTCGGQPVVAVLYYCSKIRNLLKKFPILTYEELEAYHEKFIDETLEALVLVNHRMVIFNARNFNPFAIADNTMAFIIDVIVNEYRSLSVNCKKSENLGTIIRGLMSLAGRYNYPFSEQLSWQHTKAELKEYIKEYQKIQPNRYGLEFANINTDIDILSAKLKRLKKQSEHIKNKFINEQNRKNEIQRLIKLSAINRIKSILDGTLKVSIWALPKSIFIINQEILNNLNEQDIKKLKYYKLKI